MWACLTPLSQPDRLAGLPFRTHKCSPGADCTCAVIDQAALPAHPTDAPNCLVGLSYTRDQVCPASTSTQRFLCTQLQVFFLPRSSLPPAFTSCFIEQSLRVVAGVEISNSSPGLAAPCQSGFRY